MNDEWVDSTLGELLVRVRRAVSLEPNVIYPAVSVQKDGHGLGTKEPFIGGITNYTRLFRVMAGDVVVRTITAFESPVGVAGIEHEGSHVSQVFLTYEVRDLALPGYLRLFFQTQLFWEQMRNRSQGTVLRRKTISDDNFRGIPITYPPLRVQRRIVDLMEHLDTHLANLEAERAAAAGAYAALRQNLFEKLPATRLLTDVLEAVRAGGTPSRKRPDFFGDGIPWLKSGEVDNSHIHSTAESLSPEGLRSSSAWIVPEGAVVVAMYGQGDTKGTAGFLDRPMATNQAVLALVPVGGLSDGRFLLHWMRWHTDILRAAASGAAQPNLSKDTVLRVVRFPEIELVEQRRNAALLDAALDLDRDLVSEARSMKVCRTGLLSRILGRQVEIPDDYGDLSEVAS